jgi:hypothetical protein
MQTNEVRIAYLWRRGVHNLWCVDRIGLAESRSSRRCPEIDGIDGEAFGAGHFASSPLAVTVAEPIPIDTLVVLRCVICRRRILSPYQSMMKTSGPCGCCGETTALQISLATGGNEAGTG